VGAKQTDGREVSIAALSFAGKYLPTEVKLLAS